MSDFLELEESELFDTEDETVDHIISIKNIVHENDDSPSDEDDGTGVILNFDEDSIPPPSTGQSSMSIVQEKHADVTVSAIELGTSISSLVGSLKSFEPTNLLPRRTSSENDIGIASSLPIRRQAPLAMPVMRPSANTAESSYLGTSMPISIPMLHQRRGLSGTNNSIEVGDKSFIPPHLLDATNSIDYTEIEDTLVTQSLNLSPSAAIKREKLMARNAILRSTGFIEVAGFAPPAVGEVIDIVKESTMPKGIARKTTATSSLTTLLGSST